MNFEGSPANQIGKIIFIHFCAILPAMPPAGKPAGRVAINSAKLCEKKAFALFNTLIGIN